LLRVLFNTWLPGKVVAAGTPGEIEPIHDLALLKNRTMINNRPTVYVCNQYACQAPVNDPEALYRQLCQV
jgi:uncharacterized protein YyaL (SSP411 family)